MYKNRSIGVVIPAYQEEQHIRKVVEGLPSWVDFICVVDDHSTDGTGAMARSAVVGGATRVRVLSHSVNRGVGAAIVSGYRECIGEAIDIAVVVGGDAQMLPQEMGRLLDAVVEGGADYAKGNRLEHPSVKQVMPPIRRMGGIVLSTLTAMATGLKGVKDSQCGYTAITSRALNMLPLDTLYPRYGYPNHMLALLAQAGLKVTDVPVTPIYGDNTSKLKIRKVILPISRLLIKAFVARWNKTFCWGKERRLDNESM